MRGIMSQRLENVVEKHELGVAYSIDTPSARFSL
ncbi:hypothetical protein MPLB_160020 [Mesorhizobium sp. ORS 3324]|nr:hypothetical protein MPLB_160020 [Mesorhizobium sp. ORS 3324]